MAGGIEIKTSDEIAFMREAALIVYEVLEEMANAAARLRNCSWNSPRFVTSPVTPAVPGSGRAA